MTVWGWLTFLPFVLVGLIGLLLARVRAWCRGEDHERHQKEL